ncbi:MAG: hypothetical protein MUE81_07160 [Thermoflexibacter sp.]|jgi:hypothetical protein|nr:hypothetical protein [Thermoflexibacter sp.]
MSIKLVILVVGNFNKRLFTPEWVKANLFTLPNEENITGKFNLIDFELSFIFNNISFTAKDNAVEIVCDVVNPDNIKICTNVLFNLLNLLSHTPIKAIGINFVVSISKTDTSKMVLELNNYKFGEIRNINQVTFSEKKQDYILNTICLISNDSYSITFNFHYESYESLAKLNKTTIFDHFTECLKIIN